MTKLCSQGCGKPCSRRGHTCGDQECFYKFRYGKNTESSNTVAIPAVKEEISGDNRTISLDKTRIKSLDELVKQFSIDLLVWHVERFVVNKWEVGAKDADSKLKVEELYQVKAWLVRKPKVQAAINEIESLKADFLKHKPRIYPWKLKRFDEYRFEPSGNMLELSIPDIHFGKLAWSQETGSESYDTRIATEYLDATFDALIQRTRGFDLDKIVLVLGNDLFHVDNRSNTTTSGTTVDTDSRYYKVFVKVRQLMIDKIEHLLQIAPVRIVIVPGNHDEHTSWHLGDSLECWFHGCKDVEIDNQPINRKVYQWGEVMFMWLHGDKGKKSDYPLTMATEYREMFGKTRFHEIHCGHFHTEMSNEKHGVMTRYLPSLSGTDYWHSANNYTGNKKSAIAFVWNKVDGLLATGTYTVPEGNA